jgi:pilus assembly protein CpaB
MRAKSVLLLILALGCGLVASIGITQVMAKRNAGASDAAADTQAIFVALKDIPMNDLITPELIKLEQWPKDKVPPGALTKLEDVEKRRPKAKLFQGEPILDNKLMPVGIQAGATEEIPLGYRVASVNVTKESGVSDLIRPGDRVDLLLYVKQTPGAIVETSVRTLFQDIKVFAVNDVYNLEATEGGNTINAKTVSLLLTPNQLEKFTLASELGQIRLALRSHEDKDHQDLAGAFTRDLGDEGEPANRDKEELAQRPSTPPGSDDMNNFLRLLESQKAPPAPAPEPAPERETWTVQVIRAADVEEVELETPMASAERSAQPAGTPGFNLWKAISPVRHRGADAGRPAPAETQPAAQPGKCQPAQGNDKEQEQKPEQQVPGDS